MSNEKKIQVGDKELIVRPIPYGRLKKVVKIVLDGIDGLKLTAESQNNFEFIRRLPEVVDNNLPQILALVFDEKEFPFLTPEWIDGTLTMPNLRDILEAVIEVNQVSDFLGRKGLTPVAPVNLPNGSATAGVSPSVTISGPIS